MAVDRQLPEKEIKMMFITQHSVYFQKSGGRVRGSVQEDEVTTGKCASLFLSLGFSTMFYLYAIVATLNDVSIFLPWWGIMAELQFVLCMLRLAL